MCSQFKFILISVDATIYNIFTNGDRQFNRLATVYLSDGVVFILKALISNVILFIVNNNVIIILTLIVKYSITYPILMFQSPSHSPVQ